MTLPQVALAGLVFGTCCACAVFGAIAARAAYALTEGHRWYQLKQL